MDLSQMVVDSSAWIAILIQEPDAEFFARQMASGDTLRISSATWFETAMVIRGKRGTEGVVAFEDLLSSVKAQIIPFSAEHAQFALQAFLSFGKRRHSASLNFGDCFCYGLAKALAEPLLCKGNDFIQTDLTCVVPPSV